MKAWFQLFRVPNLLTVPGDPIVGLLLAAQGAPVLVWRLVAVAMAALALYASGLAFNDYFDQDEDARHRPDRPLPSGRISPAQARNAGAMLVGVGLLICLALGLVPFAVGALLAVLMLLYNGWLKRVPVISALNMGACRGTSVLLGASAYTAGPLLGPKAVAAAVIVTLYIAAATHLARREVESEHIPRLVGWLIGALLFLQAAFAMFAGYFAVAMALALCWPLNRWLSRRFYAS